MRRIVDHLVTLYRINLLFSVERNARMINSINLNDFGTKRAWPVLGQYPDIHLDRLRKTSELFVMIVVDSANIRSDRKKALLVTKSP